MKLEIKELESKSPYFSFQRKTLIRDLSRELVIVTSKLKLDDKLSRHCDYESGLLEYNEGKSHKASFLNIPDIEMPSTSTSDESQANINHQEWLEYAELGLILERAYYIGSMDETLSQVYKEDWETNAVTEYIVNLLKEEIIEESITKENLEALWVEAYRMGYESSNH